MGTGHLYNINFISSQAISGGALTVASLYTNANMISGLTEPWFDSGAANKKYVDNQIDHVSSQSISGGTILCSTISDINDNIKMDGLNANFSASGTIKLSGSTTVKRTTAPVIDIVRNTTYTGTLIDGARLTKNQVTGGESANGGIGFVFNVDDSNGTSTRVGMFGGALATATDGSEQGEIVFNAMSGGADVQARHLSIRAQAMGTGDGGGVKGYVGVPYRLQIGEDLKDRNPSNALEVSGNAFIYSGSLILSPCKPERTPIAGAFWASSNADGTYVPLYYCSGTGWRIVGLS